MPTFRLKRAMDNEDIFHRETEYIGGRLDMSRLQAATAEGLSYALERARGFLQTAAVALPALPPIHFDFIDNWEFNACAFKADGRYFIGIYRGAFATIGVLFDRMLADSRILSFLGDAEKESADLPLIPDIGRDFKRAVVSVPEFPRPQDPVRQSIAWKLTDMACDFITAHEFAHIVNGHIDYKTVNGCISTIDELSGVDGTSESEIISQTMEMDADGVACQLSLGSEWRKIAGLLPRPAGPPWPEFYRYPGIISLLWSYAVSSIFRVFGDTRLAIGDSTVRSHPSPRLRSMMVQKETGRVPMPKGIEASPPLRGDKLYNIPMTITAAHRDVDRIFSIITGISEATEGLEDIWGDVGGAQIRRLEDYWRTKLEGELTRFAYHPLLSHGDNSK